MRHKAFPRQRLVTQHGVRCDEEVLVGRVTRYVLVVASHAECLFFLLGLAGHGLFFGRLCAILPGGL